MKKATKTGARVMVVEKDRHTGRRRTVGYGAVATVAVPSEAMGLVVGKGGSGLAALKAAAGLSRVDRDGACSLVLKGSAASVAAGQEWLASKLAGRARAPELRVDPSDGKAYAFGSFRAVYGADAPRLWRLAGSMARPRRFSSAGSAAASAVSEPCSWSVGAVGALVRPVDNEMASAPLAPTPEAPGVQTGDRGPRGSDDDDAVGARDACAVWLATLDMTLVHRAFEEHEARTPSITRESEVPPPPAMPVEAVPPAEALTARQKKRLRQRLAKDAAVAREASAAEAAKASAEAEATAARAAADAAAEAAYLDAEAEKAARLDELLSWQTPPVPASAWGDEDAEDAPDSWDAADDEDAVDRSPAAELSRRQLVVEEPVVEEPVAAIEALPDEWDGEF